MPPTLRANRALADSMRATGEAGSAESNNALYTRVAAGDPAAIREMIEANMALVVAKAKHFLARHPRVAHLQDDLIGEGFCALTKAVQSMAKAGPQQDANPTALISSSVEGAFHNVTDSPLAMSARTRFKKSKAGEQLPRTVDASPVESGHDPAGLRDLREELNACAFNDDDREILRMREQDYSDREIGIQLGKSTTHVYNARRAIEARFLARANAYIR